MRELHKIKVHRSCGFFSDFSIILSGIKYCFDRDIDFNICWKNHKYQNNLDENLFEKYFFQEKANKEAQLRYNNFTPYGCLFQLNNKLHTNNDGYNIASEHSEEKLYKLYKPLSDLLSKFNILNSPFLNSIPKNTFEGIKVLGFHKRGTDHALHGDIISDENFLQEIKKELNSNHYDKIFMITDDINSYNFFKKYFGDLLITTECVRSCEVGVHFTNHSDRDLLAREVLTDTALLSLTDKKIVTKSNVAHFSILFNLKPDNFIYIDKHVTRKH